MKKTDAVHLADYLRYMFQGFPHRLFVRKDKEHGYHVCISEPEWTRGFARISAVLDYKDPSDKNEEALVRQGQGIVDPDTTIFITVWPGEDVDKELLDSIGASRPNSWNGLPCQVSLDVFIRHISPLKYFQQDGEPLQIASRPWWEVFDQCLEGTRSVMGIFDARRGGRYSLHRTRGAKASDAEVVATTYWTTTRVNGRRALGDEYIVFNIVDRDTSYTKWAAFSNAKSKYQIAIEDPDWVQKLRDMFRQVCRTYLEG